MRKNNGRPRVKLFSNFMEPIYLIAGAMLSAFAVVAFYTPAKVTGGGATGVGTIFYYLMGADPGTVMLITNLLLFFIGVKAFGFLYGIRAFIGSECLSLFVTILTRFIGFDGVLDMSSDINVLLAAIYGGVCMGAGIGLVLKSGCNTGGMDIIAQIISNRTPLSFSTASFMGNLIIIACGGMVMGIQGMMFSIIAMFVNSHMINFVTMGMSANMAKHVLIFTDYHLPEISQRVINELGRSGTLLRGTGLYTAKNRNVLLVIVPNNQLHALTKIINEEDDKAFVIVTDAYEVLGNGFHKLRKAAESKDR